ncbi:hypothetical protein [Fodinibius sp.]|uniref:hypothetical protein n=1 Tax=Fodinibius sp. TaxID=1872440 RepID=UPI002ACD759A|nr:hypothetical protein [Fodinibius sp.]MDZ7658029.1 hypothetical protein [Fodinibius sp.]
MSTQALQELDTAEQRLQKVKRAVQNVDRVIHDMRDEYRMLDTELNVTTIANMLDCHRSTVHRMLKRGDLKSKKVQDVLNHCKQKS